VTGRAFTLTLINDVLSVISPEALHIVNACSLGLEEVAEFVNVVIISRLSDELNSVSSQGSFAPVREPLEGQLAVRSLVD
jgi:hypothetical protein